ncbi:hypothetical protein [Endobacterium cereale]|uniref:hypothetical protein n=1 Tax=Endobacterium cereale TaxID=2663029 RepID=UPI002B478D3C|nr:hypothetical protein [Endobacterium cereale]MEB2843815.1 hypothetical protein [Endobacterium cereale]
MNNIEISQPDELALSFTRTLIEARNPRWINADLTIISLEVLFAELSHLGFLPFSCDANFDTDYGVDIFNRAVAGEFGEIAAFIPLPPAPYTMSVSNMWDRMTDDEGDDFDAAMSVATPLKSRKAFNAAVTLQSDSDLFAWVRNVLLTVTTAERTDIIMGQ